MLDIPKSERFNNYWAHISENRNETLYEHTALVSRYFLSLIDIHKIDKVINDLIESCVDNKSIDLIKSIFMAVPQFHDIGKSNPNFQYVKMKNERFKQMNLTFGSDHSKIGSFLFIQQYLPLANKASFSGEEKIINAFLLFAFSFSIKKHHSSTLDYYNDYDFDTDFIDDLFSFLNSDEFQVFPKEYQANLKRMFNEIFLPKASKITPKDQFSIFALLKLNYSLLTASDYLAELQVQEKVISLRH